jgi:murein DD-endopeptidase MepM/ murein hydrolase activator NlpD
MAATPERERKGSGIDRTVDPMRGMGLAVVALAALVAQAPAVSISVDARSLQPGELVVLTIAAAPAPSGAAHVRAFDRDWPAYPTDERTWRVLLGIDLDTAPGAYEVSARIDAPSGTYRGSKTLTVLPKSFPTRRLTVDENFVNPPVAVQSRIEHEAAELARLWATSSGAPRWSGPFVRPVAEAANSAFGTRSVFNGQPRSPHGGADFLSPAGTVVKAPAGGRVLLARDLYYTGGTIMIDHGVGLISLFAHLSSIDVKEAADVAAGTAIGRDRKSVV